MKNLRWLLCTEALLFGLHGAYAQTAIDGKTNLIVNGNAETGPAGQDNKTPVASIPGWTRGAGMATVLPYGLTHYLLLTDPAPPDHGFNYFASASSKTSTLLQTIDVSSAASTISGGSVKYTLSAYLGDTEHSGATAQVTAAFQNANGQTFSTATLGPQSYPDSGMTLQQQVGQVPPGTSQVMVTLTLEGADPGFFSSSADSLSLVFASPATNPSSVLGTNLVVNGGAETGPNATLPAIALYVPGWSTTNQASVAPYGGSNWIAISDPGPADRGTNVFLGGSGYSPTMYQDIDVSPAASLIDAGQVTYEIGAWLGGVSGYLSPTLNYEFFDWLGNNWLGQQLGPTGQLTSRSSGRGTALIESSSSGVLPKGVRRVRIMVDFGGAGSLADNINFTLSAPDYPPVIDPGGVISASGFGAFSSIAPGTFVEIYGYNLASSTRGWSGADFVNGVAPTSLGDVSVSVGGQPAFVNYISPKQVNVLVPSNVPTSPGTVDVTITNAYGTSDPFGVYIDATEPGLLVPSSFNLNGKQYVAATLQDGTFALPEGAIPQVASRPANPGETVTIYGIGFGGVDPNFPAGTLVTKQNALTTSLQFLFGSTAVTPGYAGLAPSFTGLYQFNVVVPHVGANNAEPFSIDLGGTKGSQTLYIAVGK